MGYRLIGGLKARPDGIVKSGLYRFNEGAAVSVTYDSNGDMCMELGALDTEEREPDPQESEHLRQDMESFCSGYRKIREKLAEKGLVLNRGSELPPDAEYAQVLAWLGIVFVLLLCVFFRSFIQKHPMISGFLTGGMVGNTIDRFARGYVTDFLDFYIKSWHWPCFNVADIAITGTCLWLMFGGGMKKSD